MTTSDGPGTRRKSRLGRKLGIAFASLALLLVAGEIGLRMAGYAKVPARYFDPEIGVRYLPNQTRTMLGPRNEELAQATLNGAGYRGPFPNQPNSADILRIACIGDSFTFGWNVEDDETYPAVLEELLTQEVGGRFEVVNFGVPGYNTWNELQTYRRIARPLHADVVVIGFHLNDLQPPDAGPRFSETFFMRLVGKTALAEAFHIHLRHRIPWFDSGQTPEAKALKRRYKRNRVKIQFQPDSDVGRPYWETTMADLRALVQEARADGARVLFVVFPSNAQIARINEARKSGLELEAAVAKWSRPQARLARECAELDLPYLDLLPPFLADEGLFGKVDYGHPSPRGYQVVAREILEALQ